MNRIWPRGSCLSDQVRNGRFVRAKKVRPSQDGFALIEVLISLAIVGVISSLMMVFLGQARTIMRIENTTELAMEVDAAVQFLQEAISTAEPLPLDSSTPENEVFFRGDSSQLQFTSVQAIGFATSSLREMTIAYKQTDPTKESLGRVILVQSKRRENAGQQANVPITLLDNATDLSFEFLDVEGKSWITEWNLRRRLPRAVRFRISVIRDGMTYSSQGVARLALAFY